MSQSEPIQLPISILSMLYKNVLLEEHQKSSATTTPDSAADLKPQPTAADVPQPAVSSKDTLVYVQNNAAALSTEHATLLHAIVKACKLSENQVHVVVVDQTVPDHAAILTKTGAKRVILFGLEPADLDLPLRFPLFQLQLFNKATYMHAPSLERIEQEKPLKIQLWKSLQQLYPL
jgi:DNA polymerase III psi subunit